MVVSIWRTHPAVRTGRKILSLTHTQLPWCVLVDCSDHAGRGRPEMLMFLLGRARHFQV